MILSFLMKIYTKTGDDGTTGLVGGKRARKDDPVIEALGAIDELNCWIGTMSENFWERTLDNAN